MRIFFSSFSLIRIFHSPDLYLFLVMTTFAVIAAAAAAGLSNGAILIIGFANLVGDAFGMVRFLTIFLH